MKLKAIDAWVTRVLRWCSYVSAFSLAAMTALVFVDVVGAKFFKTPVSGAMELTEQLMAFLTMLAMPYVALERGHIRIDLLDFLWGRIGRYALKLFGYGLPVPAMAFLSWRAFVYGQYAMQVGIEPADSVLKIDIWPSIFVVSFGFVSLTIAYILLFVKAIVEGPAAEATVKGPAVEAIAEGTADDLSEEQGEGTAWNPV